MKNSTELLQDLRTHVSHWFGLTTLLLFALVVSLQSCSDDSPGYIIKPSLPSDGSSPVRQIRFNGSLMECYDWTFNYVDGRMLSAKSTMRNPDASLDRKYSYDFSLVYGPTSVALTNQTNRVSLSATLNLQNYIEKLQEGENRYFFSYTNGYLTSWQKEEVVTNSVGQTTIYRSSAVLTYTGDNLSKIVYTGVDEKPLTLLFTPSTEANPNGLLPAVGTREMGCLGFEYLYYAGMLGRPSRNLVQKVEYVYSPGVGTDYSISFRYNTSSGKTDLCTFETSDGRIGSVNYSY